MKTKTASVIAILTLSLLPVFNVFADNPYGIVYEGGEPLGADNVQIDPEMIDGLTPLVKLYDIDSIEPDSSSLWKEAYIKLGNQCTKSPYISFYKDTSINTNIKINGDKYDLDVMLKDIVFDGDMSVPSEDAQIALIFHSSIGSLELGYWLYSDPECSVQVENIKKFSTDWGVKVFVRAEVMLKDKTGSIVTSDQLFYTITDIDASQSFMILNANNKFSRDNMYARSESDLQHATAVDKNMFVLPKGYIYSDNTNGGFSTAKSDIFVKLKEQTQKEGVDIVFGFAVQSGLGMEYYAKEYTAKYTSDEYGKITGVTEETLLSGNAPSGTTIKAADGYELKYWTADKDVKLSDGKTIAAGKPILASQLKQVVVNSDITFTAIHGLPEPEKEESPIAVPNTGSSTSETNAALVSISVFGVLLGALMIGVLPKIHHKKVGFKKM